jgi:hypothetical protein
MTKRARGNAAGADRAANVVTLSDRAAHETARELRSNLARLPPSMAEALRRALRRAICAEPDGDACPHCLLRAEPPESDEPEAITLQCQQLQANVAELARCSPATAEALRQAIRKVICTTPSAICTPSTGE